MARFALFTNGVKVETLEDLKENFTLKDMENNFRTKSLHRWLAEKGLQDGLKKIEGIPPAADDLADLLMECFALSDDQKAAVRLRAKEEEKRIPEEKEPQNPQSVIGLGLPQEEFGFEDSCLLGLWRVQVGDEVKEGEVLCEAETGMRSFNFLSPFNGTVSEILVHQGESVTGSTPILKLSSNIDQIDIRMPNIFGGIITVYTRRLSLWHVKIGDVVNVGDILCEVQDGPRRSFNVKSQFTGVVSEILAPIGIDVGDISTPPVLLRLRTSTQSPASASCKKRVDVFLTRGNDENKIFILKELRFASDCDFKKAKDTYDSIPSVVVQNISLDAAEIIKRRIERLGGGVTLENSQATTHSEIGHDVILQNYPVENKIAIIKELRCSFISCEDLKKAKELAESVPNVTIARNVSIEAASIIKRILESPGLEGSVAISDLWYNPLTWGSSTL